MKVKHLLIGHLFLIALAIWVLFVAGCETLAKPSPNRWEWEAGKMYFHTSKSLVCRHRIAILAEKMKSEGEKFNIVAGKNTSGRGHIWIELIDGTVIDPTQASRTPRSNYPRICRLIYVNQGSAVNDVMADEYISTFKDGLN